MNNGYKEIGNMIGRALKRRRDRPRLAVLQFMTDKLEEAKMCNFEPEWGKMLKESKRIWKENL